MKCHVIDVTFIFKDFKDKIVDYGIEPKIHIILMTFFHWKLEDICFLVHFKEFYQP